jgi:hypothetical protein
MIRAKHIYIAGQKCPDSSNRKWTDAEIDAAYAIVCQSLGLVNPPPNQWYPLNILGYNYSITKRGHLKNNKFDKLIEGTVHKRQRKFKMTNDSGVRQVTEYAGRLVATMFLPPPPSNTFSIVCYHDKNPLNCDVFNLYWACEKIDGPVGKPSAKVVRPPKALMNKTPTIHFQRTPNPAENDEAIAAATIAARIKEAWNAPVATTTKSTKPPTFPEMPSSPLWEDETDEEYAEKMHEHALSQRRPKPRNGEDDEEWYADNN